MPPQNPPDKIDQNQETALFVCLTCGKSDAPPEQKGPAMLAAVQAAALPANVRVQPVKCFGACNHPCAIGVAAPAKVGFLFGNLLPGHVPDIIDYLKKYQAVGNGVVPRDQRPESLRDILIRLPHPEWVSTDGKFRPQLEDEVIPPPVPFRQAIDDA